MLARQWQRYADFHAQAAQDPTASAPGSEPDASTEPDTRQDAIYAPYDKIQNGRHSSESVDEFLDRVPPIDCPLPIGTPWLWVANPHHKPKQKKQVVILDGESDEDEDANSGWQLQCRKILDDYEHKAAKITEQMEGKAKATITRRLNPLRKDIPARIQQIAKDAGMVCGKWMLFPSEDRVMKTWRAVCKGVVEGRLGHAAKIAAHPGGGSGHGRLICVYTEDFSDVQDVKRVLFELVDLGLVPAESYGIHYKCDAYTYLGIESKNEYGMKASIYSSNQLLQAG